MTSVTIPSSVTSIRYAAFEGCVSLREVKLPMGVTLEGRVFKGCESLEKVEFAENIKIEGYCLFDGCSSLIEVDFPESTIIGDVNYMFWKCKSLKKLYLPGSVLDNLQKRSDRTHDYSKDERSTFIYGTSVGLEIFAKVYGEIYPFYKFNQAYYGNGFRELQTAFENFSRGYDNIVAEEKKKQEEQKALQTLEQVLVKMDSVAQKGGDLDLRSFLIEAFPDRARAWTHNNPVVVRKFVIPTGIKSISAFDIGGHSILNIDTLVIPSTVTYLEPCDYSRYIASVGYHGVTFKDVKVICYEGTSKLDWYSTLNNDETRVISPLGVITLDKLREAEHKKYMASMKGSITNIKVTTNYVHNHVHGVRIDVPYRYSGLKASAHHHVYLFIDIKGPDGQIAGRMDEVFLGQVGNTLQSENRTYSYFLSDRTFSGVSGKTYTYTVEAGLYAAPRGGGSGVKNYDKLSTKKKIFYKKIW